MFFVQRYELLRGLTFWQEGRPEDRNLADAQKLAAKVAAKQAAKEKEQLEESAGSSSNGPIVPKKKKVAKKDDTLDDLLSAGLSSKGKKK
jgi:hypothetical protein